MTTPELPEATTSLTFETLADFVNARLAANPDETLRETLEAMLDAGYQPADA